MSYLAIVSIESPAPVTTQAEVQQKLKEKPLQLTLSVDQRRSRIWSPFGKISSKTIEHIEGVPDLYRIHQALIEVKQDFPQETQIVFMPHSGVNYDVLVGLMDTMRSIESTDPLILTRSQKTGMDVQAKYLFPNIVFGNLLGDS